MAEHPVIACYRGPDSAAALQLAAALAAALREPLVLAVAYRYEPVALSAVQVPPAINDRRAIAAEDALRRARRIVGPATDVRDVIVAAADVADGLADEARELDACLLVLGRDVDGHVVRGVLARAACPVVVSPFDVPLPEAGAPATFAVADDGSPPAALARVVAERLAATAGTTPAAVTAGAGDAADQLVTASRDYDLLVCGSRGRGRLTAALLGSVSSRLVAAARCPVVVVGARAAAAPDRPLGVTTAGWEG